MEKRDFILSTYTHITAYTCTRTCIYLGKDSYKVTINCTCKNGYRLIHVNNTTLLDLFNFVQEEKASGIMNGGMR